MGNWATLLLVVYCAALVIASLLGGLLPGKLRMTHTRIQLVMSFVSGLMLGVGIYHLLPHSIVALGGPGAVDTAVWWLMIGLITMLLLLRMFHFHQHDFSSAEQDHHHHGHHLPQDCPATPDKHVDPVPASVAHPLSWIGVTLGLSLHTVIDGLALGAAVSVEALSGNNSGGVSWFGFGIFLAILLHKPLDSMSIVTLMENGGWSRTARNITNLLFAIMCPLGALLFFLGIQNATTVHSYFLGVVLAFAAGAFICIALSDLLPEVHFHSHDRGKLSLVFVLGLAFAYGMGQLEPSAAHSGYGEQQQQLVPQTP